MQTIDLHGYIEQEAIPIVLNAFLSLSDGQELEIITGNGIVLRDLVLELIEEENMNYKYIGANYGSIIVWK